MNPWLSSLGGIVALGKFDALHIGHRELASQAAKVGPPFLLSFVGMAEVLGWEPRYGSYMSLLFVYLKSSFPMICGLVINCLCSTLIRLLLLRYKKLVLYHDKYKWLKTICIIFCFCG